MDSTSDEVVSIFDGGEGPNTTTDCRTVIFPGTTQRRKCVSDPSVMRSLLLRLSISDARHLDTLFLHRPERSVATRQKGLLVHKATFPSDLVSVFPFLEYLGSERAGKGIFLEIAAADSQFGEQDDMHLWFGVVIPWQSIGFPCRSWVDELVRPWRAVMAPLDRFQVAFLSPAFEEDPFVFAAVLKMSPTSRFSERWVSWVMTSSS